MHMDQLPPEIIQYVTLFADQNSKNNLRRTCTTLSNLIDQRDFTIYFARSEQIPKMVKVFSRYKKPISLTFKKTKMDDDKAVKQLSKLTNLTGLSFDRGFIDKIVEDEMKGFNRLTNLLHLEFGDHTNYGTLLPSFSQLTRLVIGSLDDSDANLMVSTNFRELDLGTLDPSSKRLQQRIATNKHLTSLKIRETKLHASMAQLLDQLHGLKSLDLGCQSLRYLAHGKVPLQIGTLTNLENLHVMYYTITDMQKCIGLTSLNFEGNHEQMENWAALTKLKKLELNLRGDVNQLTFLENLSNLEDFTLINYNANWLKETFKYLPINLTALEIFMSPTMDVMDLTKLVNLNRLKLGIYREYNNTIDFTFLNSLINLTHLLITNACKDVKVSLVPSLTNLKKLEIFSQDIEEFDYSQLPNLENLALQTVNAQTAKNLVELSKLTKLAVRSEFSLNPNIAKKLALKSLDLSYTPDDEFWQSLVHLKCLEELSISLVRSNEESVIKSQEAKIISLSALQNLAYLTIYGMSKINVKCFSRLTSLQRLILPQRAGPDDRLDSWYKESSQQYNKLMKTMKYLYSVKLK